MSGFGMLGEPGPFVIHAPNAGGDGAACGSEAKPYSIIASGTFDAVDCPGCGAVLATDKGLVGAIEGAFKACARLAAAQRARRLREHAEALVQALAKQEGREKPTGADARQVLEELTQIRGEVAAIAGELDRKAGR